MSVRCNGVFGWIWLLVMAVAGGFGASACSVDTTATDPNLRFRCETDDDCISPSTCTENDDGVGYCDLSIIGPDCRDNDQDGFTTGPGCVAPGGTDCNDEDNLINPEAEEDCNGADDNCNDDIDEDIAPRACDLQAGVCAGSMTSCVDGDFQDCEEEGLYPDTYEPVAEEDESCDGLNNNCDTGATDRTCECAPGDPPRECGHEIGSCERGIELCGTGSRAEGGGEFSDCVEATRGSECTSSDECGENGFCVTEQLVPDEDPDDDCEEEDEPGCEVSVCRTLLGSTPCDSSDECGGGVCGDGFCQETVNAGDVEETCNGIDDTCDGNIDEGNACDVCPFNAVLVQNVPTRPQGICVDQYEASHPDATDTDEGSDDRYAVSMPDVLPWTGMTAEEAQAACEGDGSAPRKTLCQGPDLEAACEGLYPYGDEFIEGACNDASTTPGLSLCGAFESCVGALGIYDLSGNAGEVFTAPFPTPAVFGGHTDDDDPVLLSCDYQETPDFGGASDNVGFRCCRLPNN